MIEPAQPPAIAHALVGLLRVPFQILDRAIPIRQRQLRHESIRQQPEVRTAERHRVMLRLQHQRELQRQDPPTLGLSQALPLQRVQPTINLQRVPARRVPARRVLYKRLRFRQALRVRQVLQVRRVLQAPQVEPVVAVVHTVVVADNLTKQE